MEIFSSPFNRRFQRAFSKDIAWRPVSATACVTRINFVQSLGFQTKNIFYLITRSRGSQDYYKWFPLKTLGVLSRDPDIDSEKNRTYRTN